MSVCMQWAFFTNIPDWIGITTLQLSGDQSKLVRHSTVYSKYIRVLNKILVSKEIQRNRNKELRNETVL